MIVARLKERLGGARRATLRDDPFDADFFARLDRVRLRFRRARGERAGETPVRGLTQSTGIEVESFKTYAPGDDIRYVDWNAVGRLDQLLTRRFVAEREIPVHLLLDASASMGIPDRDGKFAFGRQAVAALAYIALGNNEAVRITALRADGPGPRLESSPLLRHRGRYFGLRPYLSALAPGGGTALDEGIRHYVERHRERGLVFVVSDFLVEPAVWQRALGWLLARKLDVWAVHVVGEAERTLEGVGGRFLLRDVETGQHREVSVTEQERRRYRDEFDRRIEELRRFCHRRGVGHVLAVAGEGLDRFIVDRLPAAGALRLR